MRWSQTMHVTSWHAISVHLISRKSNSIISNTYSGIRLQEHWQQPRFFFTNEIVHSNIFPPRAFFRTFNKVFISILRANTVFPFSISISFSFTQWAVSVKVYEMGELPFDLCHVQHLGWDTCSFGKWMQLELQFGYILLYRCMCALRFPMELWRNFTIE